MGGTEGKDNSSFLVLYVRIRALIVDVVFFLCTLYDTVSSYQEMFTRSHIGRSLVLQESYRCVKTQSLP